MLESWPDSEESISLMNNFSLARNHSISNRSGITLILKKSRPISLKDLKYPTLLSESTLTCLWPTHLTLLSNSKILYKSTSSSADLLYLYSYSSILSRIGKSLKKKYLTLTSHSLLSLTEKLTKKPLFKWWKILKIFENPC